ncbi:MAG: SDR family oxidoreductase [Cucumibacter sp.]
MNAHTDWARPFFEGKQVSVAGGSSGIGLGLARAFAEAGAKVVATGVDAADVARAGRVAGIEFRVLDVTDAAAVGAFAERFDRLDVLVNCAGINLRQAEFTPENFDKVLNVNLSGAMRLCAAFRSRLGGGGSILNVASMFAFAGAGHAPAYAASKGGIAQLTKSLAIAWAAEGIRVNALAPGWIETGMTEAARADAVRNAAILSRTPMGRWGQPEDLVGAGLFLCSPLAGFITGTILPVDGGYLAV